MDMSPVHQVCLKPFFKASERGKKTRQTENAVGRQHQGMDRPGVNQVPESNGKQGKTKETGCEVICRVPATPAVKGQVKAKKLARIVEYQTSEKKSVPCHLNRAIFAANLFDASSCHTCTQNSDLRPHINPPTSLRCAD